MNSKSKRWMGNTSGIVSSLVLGAGLLGSFGCSTAVAPTPAPAGATTYAVGGSLNGLVGTGLVLQNNAGDNLSPAADGTFAFATGVTGAYAVTVSAQPVGQNCTVFEGAGTATADVANVVVDCGTLTSISAVPSAVKITIAETQALTTLGNYSDSSAAVLAASGETFSSSDAAIATVDAAGVVTGVATGTATITVTDTASNLWTQVGVTVAASAVTTYTVGGTVTGLTGAGLTLTNNWGDSDSVAAAASTFTFATALNNGTGYNVRVATQPAGQLCTLANATGTLAGANVTNVAVTCVDNFAVGVTVTGLTGSLKLKNQAANAYWAEDRTVTADGAFTFHRSVADGVAFVVSVVTQPDGQTCTVTGGSATISGADGAVTIACVGDYTVGGTTTGLAFGNSVTLQNNAGDDLVVDANGLFTFATALADTSTYAVTVSAQPSNQVCTVTNDSGTLAGANVTDVAVACIDTYAVHVILTGYTDTGLVLKNNGGNNIAVPNATDGTYTFTTHIATGSAYAVTVTQPSTQTCTVTSGSGTMPAGSVDIYVDCV